MKPSGTRKAEIASKNLLNIVNFEDKEKADKKAKSRQKKMPKRNVKKKLVD